MHEVAQHRHHRRPRRPAPGGGPTPLALVFGTARIKFLANDEALAMPPDGRIRSVWPYVIRRVKEFQRSLRPRARANYDEEDVIADLVAALLEKDDGWIPARGRYFSYAYQVIENELHQIRDRASTVPAPRNSACRLKDYEAQARAGSLSPRKADSLRQLRRVLASQESLGGGAAGHATADPGAGPPDRAAAREGDAATRRAVRAALSVLPAVDALVIAHQYGFCGPPDPSPSQVARATGLSLAEVRRRRDRALARLRTVLEPAAPAPLEASPDVP